MLLTMANTLEGYRIGILNWYDYPISSGAMERINNKIGTLQRMAYGYSDKEHFIAELYALHLAQILTHRLVTGKTMRTSFYVQPEKSAVEVAGG